MINLYVDESGSMTTDYLNVSPYFLIAIVKVNNVRALKSAHKRFVRQNLQALKEADKKGKMFDGARFKELKGSEFTPELKKKFIEYFCRNNQLELFYIVIDNKDIVGNFYENTARAFNYCIKLALTYFYKNNLLPSGDEYSIQLDERNQKTKTKYFLEEYLNTELRLHEGLIDKNIIVSYFDSCNNCLVQLADVFANIMYSELRTRNYTKEINKIKKEGYLKKFFEFPKKIS